MGYLYGHPQNAIRVYDITPAVNNDDSRRLVTKQDIAEKMWAIENLPLDYHPSIYDKGPYTKDETWAEFVGWKMSCEIDQAIEYVEPVKSQIYVIASKGKKAFYNQGGLRMAEAGGIINFRDVGVYVSKAHNLMKHGERFMTSAEGYEFAIEHSDLLSKAPDIDYIVIGKIPDAPNAVYGVAQVSKDGALLFGNVDSYKMIDRWAGSEGIKTEDFILRAIGEEYAHLIRRGKAGVPEEMAVRVWLIDIYGKLAEKTLDSETRAKYQRMISALESDLATVRQRYSRSGSRNVSNLVKMYMSDSSKLELILEAEARLEHGLTEADDVKEYVESRLDEIAEAVKEEGVDCEAVDLDAEMAEYDGEVYDTDGVEEAVCAEGDGEGAEVCATGDSGGEAGEGE